jgi:fatty-acyl-CoA synthase
MMGPSALGLGQLLLTPLAHTPHQEIVYGTFRRHSYLTLKQRIGQLAHALKRLGVGPAGRVALMDWDSHRYLESYFAVPMMGSVLVTVNVRLSARQITELLNHCGSRVILVHEDFLPLINQIRKDLTQAQHFILISDQGLATPQGFVGEYEALLAAESGEYDFPRLDENTLATSFYTTGTTGQPKAVAFSHRQLVLHTLAGAVELGARAVQGRLHRDDVYMPITPMFHAHAWGYPFIATMLGLKQVYPGRYEPQKLLSLKQQEGVTFSHCVPTLLKMLLECPEASQIDLSGWKMAVGGAALSRPLALQALERGMDVFGGYGLSETGPLLTLSSVDTADMGTPRELDLRLRTGRAIPLVKLRVTGENGEECPRDGQSLGEITAQAPWLTQGYVGDEELTGQLWKSEWLHTGDLAWRDAQGYVQIADRLKDVIKTGGEWVPSTLLENLLLNHGEVSEVAVVAKPHERWGERPVAWVVLKPKARVNAAELMEQLRGAVSRGEIPAYALPDELQVTEQLPHTSVGKINKRALREQLKQQSTKEPDHG